MNYTALSLSQSPPLAVPLRFFLTAPLFLAAAALLVLFSGPELFATRWSAAMLALTHLITLGFLGSCMLGAMQQLLPVLVGVPLASPQGLSRVLHLLWSIGVISLVAGMGLGWSVGLQAGGMLLAVVVLGFSVTAGYSLLRSSSRHATLPAMGLAVLSLGVTVTIALYLLWRFGGYLPLAHPLTRFHIGWGAVGWVGLLIIGVAYQVVPMFQITPEYPRWLRRSLVPMLALLLLLWSVTPSPLVVQFLSWLLAAGLVGFAIQTLLLQRQRRRRVADATLDFWRLAMVSLILAVVLWLVEDVSPSPNLVLGTGVLFLLGFAASAVNGMLYKIVPFLIWLHLNNQLQQAGHRQAKVPNMKQVIPDRMARWQFRFHLSALLLLLLALFTRAVPLALIGGVWLASSGLLWWNLVQALRLYRRVLLAQGN